MNAQTPQKFTLEEIAERKKKLLNEIHAQKKGHDSYYTRNICPTCSGNQQGGCTHAFVQYRYGCIRWRSDGNQDYAEGAGVF